MTKEIKIGDCIYKINYTPETADAVLNKIIKWMQHPKHYASSSGEGIMQSDNTMLAAPILISDIVDDILKPEFVRENETN
jgi:hypothetical protein